TPCMATRSALWLMVVRSAATWTPRCRSTCKLQALSLPELHASRAFTLRRLDGHALPGRYLAAQPGVQAEQRARVQQVSGQRAAVEGNGRHVTCRQARHVVGIRGGGPQP